METSLFYAHKKILKKVEKCVWTKTEYALPSSASAILYSVTNSD
jgi:hypothetical protein